MIRCNEPVGKWFPFPALTNQPPFTEVGVMAESIIVESNPKKQGHSKIHVETEERFGRLTIIEEIEPYITPKRKKHRQFLCRCDCGVETSVSLKSLRHGHTKSCGCLKKDIQRERRTTHGLSKHPLFWLWHYMKSRCENPNNTSYLHYGGRGITVCKEWKNDVEAFVEWATVNGWKKGLLIDRRDNDKGYSPDNCRFVDSGLSVRNRRLTKANSSGYRGVSWDNAKKKWMVQIKSEGKRYYLGRYNDLIEAVKVYDQKAKELNVGHPLNFQKGKSEDAQ